VASPFSSSSSPTKCQREGKCYRVRSKFPSCTSRKEKLIGKEGIRILKTRPRILLTHLSNSTQSIVSLSLITKEERKGPRLVFVRGCGRKWGEKKIEEEWMALIVFSSLLHSTPLLLGGEILEGVRFLLAIFPYPMSLFFFH